MVTSRIIGLIKKHEMCRLCIYKDSRGFPTIGWGHLILPSEDFSGGITQDQADIILLHDVEAAANDAIALISNFDDLCEVRQAVLIDMAFNLGRADLSKFKRAIAAIQNGDFVTASNEMKNSLWYKQVKTRGVENCNLMRRGTWI